MYNSQTSEPTNITLEESLTHAIFDYADAQNSGDTFEQFRAGSYIIGLALLNDIGGKGRIGRASKITPNSGPKFGDLRDHARRHSNLSAGAYYRSAVHNMSVGRPFRFRHDGSTKRGFITRIGPDRFRFTSTTLSGNRIFTHMDLTTRNLRSLGITLPKGF